MSTVDDRKIQIDDPKGNPWVDRANGAAEEALKNQQELMILSLKLNTAMAYLQMALSLSGKVAGR